MGTKGTELLIYCLKCKTKTPTLEVSLFATQNMIKGLCSVCKKYKTSFISGAAAAALGTGLSLNSM